MDRIRFYFKKTKAFFDKLNKNLFSIQVQWNVMNKYRIVTTHMWNFDFSSLEIYSWEISFPFVQKEPFWATNTSMLFSVFWKNCDRM